MRDMIFTCDACKVKEPSCDKRDMYAENEESLPDDWATLVDKQGTFIGKDICGKCIKNFEKPKPTPDPLPGTKLGDRYA